VTPVRVEHDDPQRPERKGEPVAARVEREAREEVSLGVGAAGPVLVVAEGGDRGDVLRVEGRDERVERLPLAVRPAVEDAVARDGEKIGVRVRDGTDDELALGVVLLAPEFEDGRSALEVPDDDEARAVVRGGRASL
jgi:hypothetical protein